MTRTFIRGGWRAAFGALLIATLAACGGGSDTCVDVTGGTACEGNGGGGTTPTPVAADLVLVLSAASVSNSGTATVTATVTTLDANRNALAGAPVTLSANAGGIVTVPGAVTVSNSSGVLTGVVGIGSDTTVRTITVTAVSGSITRSAALSVVANPDGAQATSIEVLASATTVKTGGDTVLLTAFVKDASNNAMASQPVSFSASTGTLSAVGAITNASGAATASFSAGSDRSNRSATVTVTAGAITQTLVLQIQGTSLTISGRESLALNDTADYTVTAEDSNGNRLSGVTVTATSQSGNFVSPDAAVTDASGQATFRLVSTRAGADTLRFFGAGAQKLTNVTVSGDDFSFTTPAANTLVNIGQSQTISVNYRVGGVAQAGSAITFAATGGTLTSTAVTTNASGVATTSISSTSAGPVIVQATVAGGTTSATLPISFVATNPASLVLQVGQASIAPNPAGSTTNNTQIIARVVDAANNPVQGKAVTFRRVADPSGGSLQQASATTDASGQATVTYVSGSQSTAANGVVLEASVPNEAGTAITGIASLTVNQTALFITLGTGNVVASLDAQTYRKDWVVYVTDADGNAVSGVTLTFRAIPTKFGRGRLVFLDPVWGYQSPIETCPNEDVDRDGILDSVIDEDTDGDGVLDAGEDRNSNGVLDTDEDTNNNDVLDPGEDKNGNGRLDFNEDDNGDGVLWPGNVVAVSPGSVQTDATGRATISLIYAESYAPWVEVTLTATARVSGTESRRDATFTLPGQAADFSDEEVPPAGVVSPFGDLGLTVPAGCTRPGTL